VKTGGMTQTILITGASSGLGAEMARQFADLGYDLGLSARRTDRLEELRDEILARHPDRRVELRALDVTDHDAVFTVVRDLASAYGRIDRVVVNAGIGKGAPLGTGRFDANRATAMTNFVGALAQVEAAMEVFRAQGGGHLVMVSSMSGLRGLPRSMATYAATKAGVAHLVEGLRMEFYGKPGYDFTVLYPGYIRSEMNDGVAAAENRMMVSTEKGVAAMVSAIEKKRASACVPPLPWAPLSVVMKHAPLPVFRKMI
jgi:short-subunit dehydrogenase